MSSGLLGPSVEAIVTSPWESDIFHAWDMGNGFLQQHTQFRKM